MGRIKGVRFVLTSVMLERVDGYFSSTASIILVYDNEMMKPKIGLPGFKVLEAFDQDVKVDRAWSVKVIFIPEGQYMLLRGQGLVE